MKTLFVIIALFTLATSSSPAQDPKPEPTDWWSNFAITPFGAVEHSDFQGKGTWGAGLDVGYYINHTVSVHISNLGTEVDDWRGSTIDETSALFQADLIRDSRERFVAGLLGSLDRYWDQSGHKDDGGNWGVGIGACAELRLSKNFSFGVDYRVRFREDVDMGSLGRGFFRLRF